MRVDSIMSKTVATCSPQDSLEQAAMLMWQNDCGCLPVCSADGRIAGIITDRDICMCALLEGTGLRDQQVATAMAPDVLCCSPDDSPATAERKMAEGKVRRLPVVSDNGVPLGVVSLADLAREAARQQNASRHDISCSEVCSTLAAICTPPADGRAA